MAVRFLHLVPESKAPPHPAEGPYRAILILDAPVSESWRAEISSWLVKTGCLYMMAWGRDATKWDDSVDMANIEDWNYEKIPKEKFIYTTWHDDQSLDEVFWHSEHGFDHSCVELVDTILIHIAIESDESLMLSKYAAAQDGD